MIQVFLLAFIYHYGYCEDRFLPNVPYIHDIQASAQASVDTATSHYLLQFQPKTTQQQMTLMTLQLQLFLPKQISRKVVNRSQLEFPRRQLLAGTFSVRQTFFPLIQQLITTIVPIQ